MLARSTLRLAAQPPALGAAPAGARNMATLREIELRLKSVRNIEKITKVSRMFSHGGRRGKWTGSIERRGVAGQKARHTFVLDGSDVVGVLQLAASNGLWVAWAPRSPQAVIILSFLVSYIPWSSDLFTTRSMPDHLHCRCSTPAGLRLTSSD